MISSFLSLLLSFSPPMIWRALAKKISQLGDGKSRKYVKA